MACIQESHLQPHPKHGCRFIVRGYQTFKQDRQNGPKGGVVTLVKNNITATEVEINTGDKAEMIGVNLHLQNKTITVFNCYCPPRKEHVLHAIVITNNCIVLGDFNSHSPSWGYTDQDARGEEVEDWHASMNLLILNDPEDPPTFYSRVWRTTSTPDLAFATEDIARQTIRHVQDQLGGSDHRPIMFTLKETKNRNTASTLTRWNYKKANWELFSTKTNELALSINAKCKNVNKAARAITTAISQAAKKSIPRGARKNYRPFWTDELEELEKEVNTAREKAELNPSVENNVELKHKTAVLRKETMTTQRKGWQEKTASLNVDRDGTKLWQLTAALDGKENKSAPIALLIDGKVLTGKETADQFIQQYANVSDIKVSKTRLHQVKQDTRQLNKEIDEQQENSMNTPFTSAELEAAISDLKTKKSPGEDGITNEMIQHLGKTMKRKLLQLYNTSWKSGIIPQAWKEATMIPIHKSGKDRTTPASYRPISLLSCLGKTMERMINTRLMWYLEHNNILIEEQAGFRKGRCTEDQITLIAQEIEDGFQVKKHTVVVWVDMEKAFDRVWREGLLYKLKDCGVCGNMYKWMGQYLHNRKARVRSQYHKSRSEDLRHGVPQGGILSPTLFTIFVNDIQSILPKGVQGALYADDMAMWTTEEHIGTAQIRLQEALDNITKWTEDWMMKMNPDKTTYTTFTLSTKKQPIRLYIEGNQLKENETPTYLGVTFDKRLTWKPQAQKCQEKGVQRTRLLRRLAGTQWGADLKVLKTAYTGYVRPVLEYGISAWGTTAKSNLQRVERVQNQNLRAMTGGLKSTPIQKMETLTGLESIEERKDTKLLIQRQKYKAMPSCKIFNRINSTSKGRLKRTSFANESKQLEKKCKEIGNIQPKELLNPIPPCRRETLPTIITTIKDMENKALHSDQELKHLTETYLDKQYPSSEWIRVFTDGSAEKAIENRGSGIFITLPGGSTLEKAIASGARCSNYKAEAEAIKEALVMLDNHATQESKVVILSDAKSVLQTLDNPHSTDLNSLLQKIVETRKNTQTLILQWIPGHCNVMENERADTLARTGS